MLGPDSLLPALLPKARLPIFAPRAEGPFYLLSFFGKRGCFLKQLEAENSRQEHTRPFRPSAPLEALSASAVRRMAIR